MFQSVSKNKILQIQGECTSAQKNGIAFGQHNSIG